MKNESWEVLINWNFPYAAYLKWVEEKKSDLLNNPEKQFILICSHPHCFTMGRGLRENLNGPELTQLDENTKNALPFPLYQINRGGGLTFHYPGQIIVYPMVNLNHFKRSLMVLMHKLLSAMGETFKVANHIHSYSIPKSAYGLWINEKKIASIGMGMDKYITEHGLAANILNDSFMFNAIKNLYPCGMSSNSYDALENISGRSDFNGDILTETTNTFLELFFKSLK